MSKNDRVSVLVSLDSDVHQKSVELANAAGMTRQKVYQLAIEYALSQNHFVATLTHLDLFKSVEQDQA